MAVISRPFAARLRFINSGEDTLQTLSRIHPSLTHTEVEAIRQSINGIRRNDDPRQQVTGGYYTIMDELVEA